MGESALRPRVLLPGGPNKTPTPPHTGHNRQLGHTTAQCDNNKCCGETHRKQRMWTATTHTAHILAGNFRHARPSIAYCGWGVEREYGGYAATKPNSRRVRMPLLSCRQIMLLGPLLHVLASNPNTNTCQQSGPQHTRSSAARDNTAHTTKHSSGPLGHDSWGLDLEQQTLTPTLPT